MNEILLNKLLEWNSLGFIPGPLETEKDLNDRANYCLNLYQKFPSELQNGYLEKIGENEECWKITRQLYDFAPLWTPLVVSNHKLPFWHGACAWIFQAERDSPLGAFFQIRKVFKTRENYLGIYNKNILIAHEAVHVARMAFEEPKFEEYFAYKISSNPFHRMFGPIISSSKEAALFVFIIFLLLLFDVVFLFFGLFNSILLSLHIVPLVMILAALIRLTKRHIQLKNCLSNLSKITDYPTQVACRLTDQEVIEFGKLTFEELKDTIKNKISLEIRWKVIYEAYFKK